MKTHSPLPHPGPIIAKFREKRGLTMEDLAEKAGVTAATISRIESEKSRGHANTIAALFAALDLDPSAMAGLEEDGAREAPGSSKSGGPLRGYTLETTFNGKEVFGADVLSGDSDPDSPYAGLKKALQLSHLHRAGSPDHRQVELAGVPQGSILIDCRAPLEVRVGGVITELQQAGTVLVADPLRRPEPEDLVLALHTPDLTGEPEKAEVFAQIRRFELGPRNVGMLFELLTDRAVVEGQDWRIVATVTDRRFVRP